MAEEIKKTEETEKAEALKKENKPKAPKKNIFTSKKFKHGTLSVVFTVAFVAAIVLINVILNLVLDRFDVEVDLTEGGLYTMGEEMETFIKASEGNVNFYFTSDEETLESAGSVYKQTLELVKKAVEMNDGYKMEYVDLLTNPTFASLYEGAVQGGLIVESEDTGRYKFFNIGNEFLKYVMSDGKSYSYSEAQMMSMYGYSPTSETSIAEQELLSGIMSVTTVNPVKIAVTTGFGESVNEGLTSLLEKNAYVLESFDIDAAESIPADYDVVLINAPTMDYSASALDKLDSFLSNGGLYGKNVIYVASIQTPDKTPNLDGFLAEWGLEVGMGFVCQLDTGNAYSVQGYAMPLYQKAEIVSDTEFYKSMQLDPAASFRVNGVRPVKKLWEEESNFTNVTVVQSVGDNCVVMPFDAPDDWTPEVAEEKGQFSFIVEASKVRYEGSDPICSRVIALGSEMLFDEYFLTATNYNNADVALSLFNTVTGNAGVSVTVTPKSFTAATYEIEAAQQAGIGVTFAIIIPVIIIVIGIIVWVKRKRL